MSKGGGGPQPGGGSERETAAIAIRRETDGLRGGSVVRSGGGTGGGRGRASHTDGVGQRANKRQSFLAWRSEELFFKDHGQIRCFLIGIGEFKSLWDLLQEETLGFCFARSVD